MYKRKEQILLISIILIAFFSCTGNQNYQVLSTFFDGVPNPDDSLRIQNEMKKDSGRTDISKKPKNELTMFQHEPFIKKECLKCHNRNSSNSLVEKIPQLCFSCHKELVSKFVILHGPVASGECNICHNPHQSEIKRLLIRKGNELCFYCHEKADIEFTKSASFTHKKNDQVECWNCHNPHGGDDRKFLNKKLIINSN